MTSYNSHNNSMRELTKQKGKVNFDDLKKYLMKDFTPAQAQQILMQHAQGQTSSLLQQNNSDKATRQMQKLNKLDVNNLSAMDIGFNNQSLFDN